MSDPNRVNQGHLEHESTGLGQQRVGEPGPGPRQTHPYPPSAGGPGAGSGDDAVVEAEAERATAGDAEQAAEDRS